MKILIENANGYTLIEKKKTKNLTNTKNKLNLHSIYQFQTRYEAIKSIRKIIKGKVPYNLKKFLKNKVKYREILVVNDNRMKASLKEKLGQNFFKIQKRDALFRNIKQNLNKIFEKNEYEVEKSKNLSVSYSIFCNKLKINGTKIDNMIIQAIKLFDELDKEINNYSMRLREWYSWHFPELSNLVSDNIIFAKIISRIETRERLSYFDLKDLLSYDLEKEIKKASQISLGVNIFKDDLVGILSLSKQIISFSEFRMLLQKYIKNRMYMIAPNLTAILGERVGARLIRHSGSLTNLAKCPASTIQILGAEKSLFRAVKNKKFTPKYGIIYHASLISLSPLSIRGKLSRMTSGKSALSSRIDALGEIKYGGSIGLKNKKKIQYRLRQLEAFLVRKKIIK